MTEDNNGAHFGIEYPAQFAAVYKMFAKTVKFPRLNI
jgi:hypothetical protein